MINTQPLYRWGGHSRPVLFRNYCLQRSETADDRSAVLILRSVATYLEFFMQVYPVREPVAEAITWPPELPDIEITEFTRGALDD